MTQVYAERDGQRCILSAQGHATGSVEACAAVSGILYALAGYVTNAMRERYVEVYTWRMESGDVQLDFNGTTARQRPLRWLSSALPRWPRPTRSRSRWSSGKKNKNFFRVRGEKRKSI